MKPQVRFRIKKLQESAREHRVHADDYMQKSEETPSQALKDFYVRLAQGHRAFSEEDAALADTLAKEQTTRRSATTGRSSSQ